MSQVLLYAHKKGAEQPGINRLISANVIYCWIEYLLYMLYIQILKILTANHGS